MSNQYQNHSIKSGWLRLSHNTTFFLNSSPHYMFLSLFLFISFSLSHLSLSLFAAPPYIYLPNSHLTSYVIHLFLFKLKKSEALQSIYVWMYELRIDHLVLAISQKNLIPSAKVSLQLSYISPGIKSESVALLRHWGGITNLRIFCYPILFPMVREILQVFLNRL